MTDRPLRRRSDLEPHDPLALRALVVDDDENYRFFLATLVGRFGFGVTNAADGQQALEIIEANPPFDLLIVDYEMPRINGLDLITQVRAEDRYADVHAVMITAREDIHTKISALRHGGDEFIMLVADLAPGEVAAIATRISVEISANEWTFDAAAFAVNMTAGIACSSLLQDANIAQLLSIADRDLYKNKWLRKHPDLDPTQYEHDTTRDALVVEFMRGHNIVRRTRES